MRFVVPAVIVLGVALTACASRQGIPSTGTEVATEFTLEAPSDRPDIIKVKSGDTLYGLAYKHGVTSRNLIAANDLQFPYQLKAGQDLSIPKSHEHVAVTGETVQSIAAFYGVSPVVMSRENRLDEHVALKTGDRLVIPAKDTVERSDGYAFTVAPVVASSSLAPLESSGKSVDEGQSLPFYRPGIAPDIDISSELAQENAPTFDLNAELQVERSDEQIEFFPPHPAQAAASVESSETTRPHIPIPPVRQATAAAVTTAVQAIHKVPSVPAKPELPVASVVSVDYIWPVQGKVISNFGDSINGATNDGINIAIPAGTPVQAVASGEVVYSGNELEGFGKLVLIKHSNGYMSAYAHNSKLLVQKGEPIAQGQVVSHSGSSGVEGNIPQLHFELRKGTVPIDPTPQLGS